MAARDVLPRHAWAHERVLAGTAACLMDAERRRAGAEAGAEIGVVVTDAPDAAQIIVLATAQPRRPGGLGAHWAGRRIADAAGPFDLTTERGYDLPW